MEACLKAIQNINTVIFASKNLHDCFRLCFTPQRCPQQHLRRIVKALQERMSSRQPPSLDWGCHYGGFGEEPAYIILKLPAGVTFFNMRQVLNRWPGDAIGKAPLDLELVGQELVGHRLDGQEPVAGLELATGREPAAGREPATGLDRLVGEMQSLGDGDLKCLSIAVQQELQRRKAGRRLQAQPTIGYQDFEDLPPSAPAGSNNEALKHRDSGSEPKQALGSSLDLMGDPLTGERGTCVLRQGQIDEDLRLWHAPFAGPQYFQNASWYKPVGADWQVEGGTKMSVAGPTLVMDP